MYIMLNKNTMVKAKKKMKKVGSRAQVMNGTAEKTSGGLRKNALKRNRWGRIVSRAKSEMMTAIWKDKTSDFNIKHGATFRANQYTKGNN